MADEGAGGGGAGRGLPRCSRHSERPATALCVSCARPVCVECDRRAGYRHYCPDCLPGIPPGVPYPVPPPPPFAPPPPPEPADERERRWWRADWGLAEVVVSLLVIFGLYNALSLTLLLSTENPLFYSYLSYAVFFCPLIVLSTWYIVRRRGRGWKELGIQWGRPERTLLFGGLGSLTALATSYGAFFAVYLLFYLLAGRTPVTAESEHLRDLGGGSLALVMVVVVLLAPVFEELFFRGLFYPALRRRMGPKPAIVLNGVVFGFLHFQPLFMLSLVLVGVILAYLYEKTDSLAAPMMAHALYNLVVMVVSLVAGW